jgi:hypothetical protein
MHGSVSMKNVISICMILGVRCEVDESYSLLGHSVAYSGIIHYRRFVTTYHSYLQVTNYHYKLCNIPEDRRSTINLVGQTYQASS